MKRDAPLTEVAQHLPPRAAQLLLDIYDVSESLLYTRDLIQVSILESVRDAICYMEESGVELDPIELEVVLSIVVAQSATLQQALAEMTAAFQAVVEGSAK